MSRAMMMTMAILGILLGSQAFAEDSVKNAKAKAGLYSVDTGVSNLKWTGRKVTKDHYGYLKVKKGSLKMHGSHLMGGEFVIDMTSITVEDIPKDSRWNGKLERHLKDSDFFDVSKHKSAILKIKDVQTGKGGKYNIVADLTIKGITKPVMFDADIKQNNGKVTARANIKFNRLDYDIKFNSGKWYDPKVLGDKLIYDDVTVDVNLVAKQ